MTGPEQTAVIMGRMGRSCDRMTALEQSIQRREVLRLIVSGTTLSITTVSALVLWSVL
jgi:hypothetical protein